MTEARGRELLKSTFPTVSDLVDPVVAAFGDPRKLNEAHQRRSDDMAEAEEATLAGKDMNAALRAAIKAQREGATRAAEQSRDERGRFAPQDSTTDGDHGGNHDLNDMNAVLRAAVRGRRVAPGRDPITEMRARRGLVAVDSE
jgi:hypothetical protein